MFRAVSIRASIRALTAGSRGIACFFAGASPGPGVRCARNAGPTARIATKATPSTIILRLARNHSTPLHESSNPRPETAPVGIPLKNGWVTSSRTCPRLSRGGTTVLKKNRGSHQSRSGGSVRSLLWRRGELTGPMLRAASGSGPSTRLGAGRVPPSGPRRPPRWPGRRSRSSAPGGRS